ncbi:MAG: nitrous oxide reductase accessory protein NosL [Polyangiaceae bacterium]|jgi:copper chaperone NosL|nr:nitrous oxide reductase accessory protein NosL [Polyangiaceae bacterium]
MAPLRLSRRPVIAGLAGLVGALATSMTACQRKARCGQCGMVLDPASRWYVELALADGSRRGFDAPRCAFTAWRGPLREASELFARGHYNGAILPSASLVFGLGSDVIGPMGPDLVPVEPEHGATFAREHNARSMLRAAEVTAATLGGL